MSISSTSTTNERKPLNTMSELIEALRKPGCSVTIYPVDITAEDWDTLLDLALTALKLHDLSDIR